MVTFDMFYFIVREQPLSLLFRCQNYRPFSIYFVSFLTERLFSNKTIVFLKICPKKSYVQLKTNVCEKAYSKNPSFRNQILLENSFFINKSITFPNSIEQFLIVFQFVFKNYLFQFSERSISFVHHLFFSLNNIIFHNKFSLFSKIAFVK